MKTTLGKSLLVAALSATLVACGSDGDSNNKNEAGKFVYSLKTTGEGEPEFLVDQDDLTTGTLSAQGTGEEQLGWSFYYPVGKTLFVLGYQKLESRAYTIDSDNELVQLDGFVFNKPIEMFGNLNDETLIASIGSRDALKELIFYTADAATGKTTSITNYTLFSDEDAGTVGWPAALVVRDREQVIEKDGKQVTEQIKELFVPYHKITAAFGTPDSSKAYVAIYDYPLATDAKPKKVIEDDRTGHLGVNGMVTAMIKTENDDLYTYSNGKESAGIIPASTKPSAIIRIKAGESEFDKDYFFNIEEATNGGSLFWFDYIGNNKVIARILTDESACKAATEASEASGKKVNSCAWAAYGKDYMNQKLVVIDLVAKTVTDIEGVPLHAKRYTSPITIIDGKVYLSIEAKDDDGNAENNVYIYDIATGKATKGAAIEGKTIKGFYNLR